MLILNNEQISSLLSLEEITAAVESAMVSYENQSSSVPRRMHLDHGENTLLCMPSFGGGYFATKLVSVVPGNKNKALPVTNGALLLNDAETGLPLALMNAAKLTALRTGALGAVGIRYMTPANIDSIGLIGTGVQGLHQAIFACSVRPIQTIYSLYRQAEGFEKLRYFVQQHYPAVKVVACKMAEELLEKTEVLIAATTSASPVLPNDAALLRGKHFISIGSYKPNMQELPAAVYQLAGQLAIDSEFARHETGDIINAVERGWVLAENVYTIGKLITGARQIDVHQTTAYKSAGMALYDLFTARALYQKAVETGIGVEVAL
ncbi:MAG TPA: ornithine cyclodeaminase family protein [Haliscomenobacter sp.]|uniref:ornithine cyclodeaminase family protein n=1 Tax=Haliscomenobacter sp. TaxID=2717303 RepID=UPI002B928C96|nr:ornithine cyclodeaminase family protein [Haliscomenobacter sp.]HOY17921.1 ornithine cyclodeaminase family protein [Haliscomenobacter sp.]